MATHTPKGTDSSKISGNSLTVSNVSTTAGRLLVCGVSWSDDNPGEDPVVKHGNQLLYEVAGSRVSSGGRILTAFAVRARHAKAGTSLTATWPTNLTARAITVCELDVTTFKDIISTNTQTGVTACDTGSAGTSTDADTISMGFFSVKGPGSDNPPGPAGSGHTLDQEASTSGGTATDNITLYDTDEVLIATGTIQATLTIPIARDVISTVIAFKPGPTYTVSRVQYVPWDGYPGQESIHFVMKDSSDVERFTVVIPREEFDQMSDIEVEDRLQQECVWWANKLEGAPSPDFEPDGTFDTRVASFVNDAFNT